MRSTGHVMGARATVAIRKSVIFSSLGREAVLVCCISASSVSSAQKVAAATATPDLKKPRRDGLNSWFFISTPSFRDDPISPVQRYEDRGISQFRSPLSEVCFGYRSRAGASSARVDRNVPSGDSFERFHERRPSHRHNRGSYCLSHHVDGLAQKKAAPGDRPPPALSRVGRKTPPWLDRPSPIRSSLEFSAPDDLASVRPTRTAA